MYVLQGFHPVWYQSIVNVVVSEIIEDLTYFGSDPSEISNLRSSNTPKTVAFTIP